MKIALITDTHFGARSDSQTFIRAFDRFYSNIFFPTLKERDIDTIFHLGDIVDKRKHISYVTLKSFREQFVDVCVDQKINLHVIVGNHDIPYRNTNSVNAMTELFRGYGTDWLNFYADPTEVSFDGLDIAISPWINSENYLDTLEFIAKTNAEVCFGHFDFNGFEMHRGMVQENGMDTTAFQKFDIVYSGHFHHKSQKGNITYLGNPYELTWSDYGDSRGFHIFDTNTRELEFIENPYRMFYKVVYNDLDAEYNDVVNRNFAGFKDTYVKVIVQEKTNPYWFDLMLDNLYAANPSNVTIVDDNRNMDKLSETEIIDEAEDTLTIMNKYVDTTVNNVDVTKLKKLLHTLYIDAQSVEIVE